MVAEGKKQHVSIILDFVVNHSSDQHPWFLDSKSSKTAAHRDWYVWRDGKGSGQPRLLCPLKRENAFRTASSVLTRSIL